MRKSEILDISILVVVSLGLIANVVISIIENGLKHAMVSLAIATGIAVILAAVIVYVACKHDIGN